jgi:8-oxo-dGTP diphosphatase
MERVFETAYKYCPTCQTKLVRKKIDNQNLLNCIKCGFVFWNNPKPVVSVILERDNQILLLKRANEPLRGYWGLPGGFMNYGESPEQSVIRETLEEVGATVDNLQLVGVYLIDNDPRGVHVDIIYSAKLYNDVTLSDEHSDYKFFSADDLPKEMAYKHRQAISDFTSQNHH